MLLSLKYNDSISGADIFAWGWKFKFSMFSNRKRWSVSIKYWSSSSNFPLYWKKNIPTVTNVRLVYTHFCIDSSKEITTSSTLLVLFITSVISFNQWRNSLVFTRCAIFRVKCSWATLHFDKRRGGRYMNTLDERRDQRDHHSSLRWKSEGKLQ